MLKLNKITQEILEEINTNFNTSHVEVKLRMAHVKEHMQNYFNTSHVEVKRRYTI